jgi:adenylate cyclase
VAPESAGAEVDAGYVLTGTVRNMPDRVRISTRLLAAQTGEQLRTAAYDETLSVERLLSIQERIAQQVVATIAVPYGPIFEHELARTAHKPAEHLDTYDCLLKYYYYRRTIDPTLHGEALECFELAVMREPKFADAWAGLGLLYLDEHGFGYSPQREATDPLVRAGEATRTAMDIDGQSYLANLAMARLRFFSGDLEGFERSAERVLMLDPNNADALALLGTLYAVSGATARAQPLIDKAVMLSPQPPGTYHLAHAVIELQAGRPESALAAALRIDAPNWFAAPLLVTAAASLAGRDDVARRSSARLLDLYPAFPERARQELAKWQLDPKLLEELLRGLRAAGLEIA